MHNLQGQFWGIQDLISLLNWFNVVHSLSRLGNSSFHTIGPNARKELSPIKTVLTLGLTNVFSCLVSRPLFNWNKSHMKEGHSLIFTLNISIATLWIFLWWIVMLLSFSSNSLKVEMLSLYNIRKDLSCKTCLSFHSFSYCKTSISEGKEKIAIR